MGHGDHWGCISQDFAEAFGTYIVQTLENGEPFAGFEFPLKSVRDENGEMVEGDFEAQTLGMVLELGVFSVLTVSLINPVRETLDFWTGYPFLSQGIRVDLEITRIKKWDNGIEAEITGETSSGLPVTYFDLFYFRDALDYEIGKKITVELGALAFTVHKPFHKPIIIDDPQAIAKHHEALKEENDGKPLTVRTEGMAVLLPIENWDEFEYKFQGPLKSVQSASVSGTEYMVANVTVMRHVDIEFDLPVLIAPHTIKNTHPKVGEDISGRFWIHGKLVRPD